MPNVLLNQDFAETMKRDPNTVEVLTVIRYRSGAVGIMSSVKERYDVYKLIHDASTELNYKGN